MSNHIESSTMRSARFMAIGFTALGIVFLIGFIVSGFSLVATGAFGIGGILFNFVGFGASILIGAYAHSNYSKLVKEEYLLTEYQKEFSNVKFDIKGGYSRNKVSDLQLFAMGTTYRTNDLITGTYHDVYFEQFDAQSVSTVKTGDTQTTIVHFSGQVYSFTLPKSTKNYHKLVSRSHYGKFGNNSIRSVKRISFEDERFNQTFHIYSNNDHEAFYIFTPQFMERMVQLDYRIKDGLTVVISDSRIYLSIFTRKDSHEPKLFSGVNQEYFNSIKQSTDLIKNIIDTLDLNNDYFKNI